MNNKFHRGNNVDPEPGNQMNLKFVTALIIAVIFAFILAAIFGRSVWGIPFVFILVIIFGVTWAGGVMGNTIRADVLWFLLAGFPVNRIHSYTAYFISNFLSSCGKRVDYSGRFYVHKTQNNGTFTKSPRRVRVLKPTIFPRRSFEKITSFLLPLMV